MLSLLLKKATGVFVAMVFVQLACAQVFDAVVAQDGSGDYRTIQAAIERLTLNSQGRTLIFVKNGLYKEKVWLYSSKPNVSLIGESVDGVIISWDDYSGKTATMSTAQSYTFLVEGDGFYGENLTVENTAGNVGQAVAIRTTGDRQTFKNCKFLGFQDTYYAHKKRQYNVDCYVEGATDFIFGDATAVFENCVINCVKGGQYITAPNDTKLITQKPSGEPFYHGLYILNSTITADADVPDNSYYLGRPWGAPASAVFGNCKMGSHIKPEGWSEWNNDNHLNGTFAEYLSQDLEGNKLDVSQRVEWSEQLMSPEVDAYYNLDYFLQKDDAVWNPRALIQALPAPEGLSFTSRVLAWESLPEAKGYIIYRNGELAGFTDTNSFEDTEVEGGSENVYQVKAVSANGNLSAPSEEFNTLATITGIKETTYVSFDVSLTGKNLQISENVTVRVYTLNGMLVKKVENTRLVSMESLKSGLYLLKIKNRMGEEMVEKMAL